MLIFLPSLLGISEEASSFPLFITSLPVSFSVHLGALVGQDLRPWPRPDGLPGKHAEKGGEEYREE